MSNSIKNLYQFRTTSKITQAQGGTTTFTVGNDLFTNAAVAITAGYIKLQNRTGTKVELFKVTVAAGTATISSRGIKPDGTTSTTYQYEWPKNTLCTLVVVEAQIFDKSGSETLSGNLTYTGEVTYDGEVYFPSYTTTERDAITWNRDGAFINNETTGTIQQRVGGAWYDVDTGTVTPNADEDTAGKSEKATNAQVLSGESIGETGAPLFSTPADTAKQIQSGTWVYGADAGGDDTYVVALTPTLSAYTTGQSLYAKVTTANTGACSFDFGPGAKNVKTLDGNDPQTGAIRAGMIVHLKYDGTNLILQSEDIASTTNKGIDYKYNYGGLGGDGNLTISSGTTTIMGTAGLAYKEYDNITISGTAILTSNSAITHIKCKGNFTMSAGTITVSGLGGGGGAGTGNTSVPATNGGGVVNNNSLQTYGIGGGLGANGSGGASGSGGIAYYKVYSPVGSCLFTGSGGGGGGTDVTRGNRYGNNGGAGGGCLILEIGGNINFTGGSILANGNNGEPTNKQNGGAGGGGGGGCVLILYRLNTSISGTIEAKGGNGGAGGYSTNTNDGGGAGGGGGGYGAGGAGKSTSAGDNGSAGVSLGFSGTVTGGTGGTYTGTSGTNYMGAGGGGGGGFIYVKQL